MGIFTKPVVLGISAAIPRKRMSVYDMNFDEKYVKRVTKLTGIQKICVAPDDMTPSDYCIYAADRLLQEMNFERELIDGVVFVSPYPDYILPATSGVIQRRLGLRKECTVIDSNHGCTGFLYALFQAFLMVETGFCKNVLACCGDKGMAYVNAKDSSLRMVLSAGGASMIIAKESDIHAPRTCFSFYHDGNGIEHLYIPAGGARMPKKAGRTDIEQVDFEGNVRTLEDIFMNGMEVMRFAMNQAPIIVEKVLGEQGWKKEEVSTAAFHQANQLMVRNVGRATGIPKDKLLNWMEETGNTGGASIPIALCGTLMEKKLNLKKTLLCAFGTGLSCAGGAIDFSHTYFSRVYEI